MNDSDSRVKSRNLTRVTSQSARRTLRTPPGRVTESPGPGGLRAVAGAQGSAAAGLMTPAEFTVVLDSPARQSRRSRRPHWQPGPARRPNLLARLGLASSQAMKW